MSLLFTWSQVLGSRQAQLFAAVFAAALAPACLVSFDGYKLDDQGVIRGDGTGGASGGRGGLSASGGGPADPLGGDGGVPPPGSGSGGASNGGASNGGASNGGASNGGGGSAGGAPNRGGSPATAGAGGVATGGSNTAGNGGGSPVAGAPGAGGMVAAGGTAGAGGMSAADCPNNLSGPPLLKVPSAGESFYCIDRTEVTVGMYADFLDVQAGLEDPRGACSFNTSYQPQTSGACSDTRFDRDNQPNVPVTCVDWCDAEAYCWWAGKRLCGGVGGGASLPGAFADPDTNQWYRACSAGGAREFPYGDVYSGLSCVGLDYPTTRPLAVATAVNCRGGYPGLFDMSGNVAEWENSCSGADTCAIRGGHYLSEDESGFTSRCDGGGEIRKNSNAETSNRASRSSLVGFRCCLDPN